jgi:hypothetical protein
MHLLKVSVLFISHVVSGLYVSFSTVLVGLYEEPERPANAVDYIKRYMGAPAGVDVEALRVEVEQLRADNAKLQATIKDLNSKVSLCTDEQSFSNLIHLSTLQVNS